MTIIIASIRCWKMSGAKVINYLFCACFPINFANSSLGEDGSGVSSCCDPLSLVDAQHKNWNVNTYPWWQMFWRVLVFQDHSHGLEVFFFPVWNSSSSPSFALLPRMPRTWPLWSVWWTWSSSWAWGQLPLIAPGSRVAAASRSTGNHRSYKLVLTFLEDVDLRQPGYPERQLISNKTWCSPFGAENPVCWKRTEKEHQTFRCCYVRLFWVWDFFFFLLFHAHFSHLNSSLMSSAFSSSVHMWVFTCAHYFKDKSLNSREWVQMAHPFWQSWFIIRIKASLCFKMFPLLLPQLPRDLFLLSLFLGR